MGINTIPAAPLRLAIYFLLGLELLSIQKAERLRARGVSDACFRLDHGRDYGRLRRLLGCCVASQLGSVYQTKFDVSIGAAGDLVAGEQIPVVDAVRKNGRRYPTEANSPLARPVSLIYTILKYRPQARECRIS